MARAAPPAWLVGLRLVAVWLALLALQSALSRLPAPLAPPDLLLLLALALALRLRPLPALLAGYGLGLLQDAVGHGLLGVQALGTAAGVLALLLLRSFVPLDTERRRGQYGAAALGLLGQWLAFAALGLWLTEGPFSWGLFASLPASFALTVLLAPSVAAALNWALGPRARW